MKFLLKVYYTFNQM